jgi:hypothetical protein
VHLQGETNSSPSAGISRQILHYLVEQWMSKAEVLRVSRAEELVFMLSLALRVKVGEGYRYVSSRAENYNAMVD